MSDELATEVAALRRLVEAHERRLSPVDSSDLPLPTYHRKRNKGDGMDGPRWSINEWEIGAHENPEDQECIHVRHPIDRYSGDVEAIRLDDARRIAAALLAAIDYSTNELAARRRQRQAS